MAWIKYIGLLPILYALVKGAVELVEAVSAGIDGAAKKAAVMAALEEGWAAAQLAFGITVPFEPLKPVISFLIDLIVAIYNAIGFFKKTEEPVVPA